MVFLAKLSEKVLCFGVKVRPSAMCCWQADTKGITLFLDVRCGNTGVQLKGRKLHAAQIVCMESEGADTFETAQEFCKKMCTDPIFPEFPVYGSNNWYYAYGDSSEEEILSDTDYILKLTEGVKILHSWLLMTAGRSITAWTNTTEDHGQKVTPSSRI